MYESDKKNTAFKKFNEGNYKEALIACRIHITWYILCYRAHTIPWLESESKEAKEFLTIDIEALSSLLDLLFNCYEATGKHKDFPHALDSLTNAINDQRWFNRIAYQRTLWVLVDSDDKKLAFYELNKIKDIESTTDIDILTMYLTIYPKEMSFSKRLKLIDQILAASKDDVNKLHYSALKGVNYFLIGDTDKGTELIKGAIDTFKKSQEEIEAGYGNYRLAQTLEILGEFTGEKELLKEAQARYRKEIDSGAYNSAGYAMLFKCLGDSFYASEDYDASINNYEHSLKENEEKLTKVFYVKTLIQKDDMDKVEDILNKIDSSRFESPEQYDLAFTWAQFALKTKKEHHVLHAINLLKDLRPSLPFFNNIRDELLYGLMKIEKAEKKGLVGKLSHILRRYSILQPNYFGIGVNLNNILDDAKEKIKNKKDF